MKPCKKNIWRLKNCTKIKQLPKHLVFWRYKLLFYFLPDSSVVCTAEATHPIVTDFLE